MTCPGERVLFRLDVRLFTREEILTRHGQMVYLNKRSPVAKGIRRVDNYLGEIVLGQARGYVPGRLVLELDKPEGAVHCGALV